MARSVSQRLSRQTAAATVAPPAPQSRAEQTTDANKPLGREIDELDKLTGQAFLDEREAVAVRASRYGRNHDQDVLALEAIEFIAAQRGLTPLEHRNEYYAHEGDGMRRRNVRVELEEGIRKTGSLKRAVDRIEHKSKSVESEIWAIESEADAFGKMFTQQARDFAELMLKRGEQQIVRALRSYGLDPEWANRGVEDLQRDDIEEVAQRLVSITDPWEADDYGNDVAKPRPAKQHRRSLAQAVSALKAQQQVVEDARKPMAALVKHDWQRGDYIPDQAAYDRERRRFDAADRKLSVMWAHAEERHPALASFRSTKPQLKDVDLGKLDQIGGEDGAKPQMKTMLVELLPKLRDIRVLRSRLYGGHLKPLSLAPVVALTKAAMFVPEGSIRAGKVNDLVQTAEETSVSTYIAEGLMALIVLATLIPTAGASLGVAIGLAGAALSATSAVEDWESYKEHKMLNNTALDRAKALSTEEPSLLPFAVDLISLGIDGLPLIKGFHAIMELRNLVRARQEAAQADRLKRLLEELDRIGREGTKPTSDLGKQVLKDLQTAEHDAAASTQAAAGGGGKPPQPPKPPRFGPEPPTPTSTPYPKPTEPTVPKRPSTPHPKPPPKPNPYAPGPPKPSSTAHPKPPPKPNPYGPEPPKPRTEHPKPPERPSPFEPQPPRPGAWRKPPGGKYDTLEKFGDAVRDRLKVLKSGLGMPNSEWVALQKVDWATLTQADPAIARLWEDTQKLFVAKRDPLRIERLLSRIYEGAGYRQVRPQDWLVDRWGRSGMPELREMDLDPEVFKDALRQDKPAIDFALDQTKHGAYVHQFDELLMEDVLGGKDAARNYRRLLVEAIGPSIWRNVGGEMNEYQFFSQIWDAVFDSTDLDTINNADCLGAILVDLLGFLGKTR